MVRGVSEYYIRARELFSKYVRRREIGDPITNTDVKDLKKLLELIDKGKLKLHGERPEPINDLSKRGRYEEKLAYATYTGLNEMRVSIDPSIYFWYVLADYLEENSRRESG